MVALQRCNAALNQKQKNKKARGKISSRTSKAIKKRKAQKVED
ncbi:hypothetical protein [Variovorax sp. LjRoot178]